ncbi:MAG TPA: alpha/beta hydrolase-fold protein [Pyrinomonadaceae bacterium]|jgi:S-formylglutathione hydrolase FrmB|nr:alpha/beta hydrolase-fold protein [Pyrinomonadaceae bacterium]
MKRLIVLLGLLFLINTSVLAQGASQKTSLRFEVTLARGLVSGSQKGRLFIFLNLKDGPEPRLTLGSPALDSPPMLAKDIESFTPGTTVAVIDGNAIAYPIDNLAALPPGDYNVQALFDTNIDLSSLNAPGNLYSTPQKVNLDAKRGGTVKLELTQIVPPEQLPTETEYVKYVRIQSPLLSKFHGRPIYLRAGIILPRDYEREPNRRYPLRIHIGGFATKFTVVQALMNEKTKFHKTWLADDTPRMIYVLLDGDGPYGDPSQVNSANDGPYGDATTQELIPYIEQKYRAIGKPYARVLDGGSTGGWASLALQVFYPDFFNGTWSGYPDPVDFRAYQLVDIYKDENAYINNHGFERPSDRDANGDIAFTMRLECQMENMLGAGDSYTMSGGQWGAWNALFGPRGADHRPVPLWNAKTGKINHEVAEQWKKYDLRLMLEQNWKTLSPGLKGKLHIWVGEADDYFLNNAVHLLDDFLSKADPPYGGSIVYGQRGRHGWSPMTDSELMKEMMRAIEKTQP